MATSQAAFVAEKAVGHGNNATIQQDVSNPALDPVRLGDPNERMKALAWIGKNKVELGS